MREILPQTMFLYDTFSSLTTLLSTWQYFAGQPPLLTKIWGPERGALWLPFLDLERRSKSIFGIQSAHPLWTFIGCWERAPLSTHIWHSERPPPAFKLYMVLRAPPALKPYLAFRAPPRFQAIYGVESVPRSALSLKMRVKAPPPALDLKFWLRAAAALQSTVR